ncbi:MAG: tail fiber protein [Flavipsychrobacter sp.]|nr:tail fiber protein [Flavipsychrobacter sp.]
MTEPFIGSIQYFGFNYAPRGWHACDGTVLQITQYQALFAVLGTYYGGDGRTTFALPDLRGRAMISAYIGGTVPTGLTPYNMGTKAGVTGVTLTSSALPQHTHTVTGLKIAVNNTLPNSSIPVNEVPGTVSGPNAPTPMYTTAASTNTFLGTPNVTVNSAGGSQPFNVQNPYLALNCCVALQGLFPSRN